MPFYSDLHLNATAQVEVDWKQAHLQEQTGSVSLWSEAGSCPRRAQYGPP